MLFSSTLWILKDDDKSKINRDDDKYSKEAKIMFFNKAGRKLNVNFTINEQRLEVGTEYKYLGIVFCPSGSFTKAKENLYKRSLKSLFQT